MVSLAKTVRSSVLLTDPIEIKSSCLREVLGVSFLQCPSSLPPGHNSETFFFLQSGDLKPFADHLRSTNYRQQLSPFAINNLLSSYELAMCVKANLTVFPVLLCSPTTYALRLFGETIKQCHSGLQLFSWGLNIQNPLVLLRIVLF